MASTQNQNETTARTRKLEKFYKELTTYLIFNLFFVAIWFFSGRGYFWPIWAMLGWGVAIGYSAANLIRLPSKK